jgi:hypothetical protein
VSKRVLTLTHTRALTHTRIDTHTHIHTHTRKLTQMPSVPLLQLIMATVTLMGGNHDRGRQPAAQLLCFLAQVTHGIWQVHHTGQGFPVPPGLHV